MKLTRSIAQQVGCYRNSVQLCHQCHYGLNTHITGRFCTMQWGQQCSAMLRFGRVVSLSPLPSQRLATCSARRPPVKAAARLHMQADSRLYWRLFRAKRGRATKLNRCCHKKKKITKKIKQDSDTSRVHVSAEVGTD